MKIKTKYLRKLVNLKWKVQAFLNKANMLFEDTNERLLQGSQGLLDSLEKPTHKIEDGFAKKSSILKRSHKGLTLDGRLSITKDQSYKNILVSGKTGSGKSVSILLPIIYRIKSDSKTELGPSIFVHDPSKEIALATTGYLISLGYTIIIIDFNDALNSMRYNPLPRINTKGEYNQFAQTIITNQSKGKVDFWSSKAVSILVFIIELQKELPQKYDTLHNLAHLVEIFQSASSRESLDKLVVYLSQNKPELFTTYSSIISMSENTLSGVLATLSNSLSIYLLDENLAKVTSEDNLGHFSDFRKNKTAVFIHSSTTKMEYYSPISTLFFNQYFDEFFNQLPESNERDVYFLLDETPVLKINNLDVIASNIRKYRGVLLLIAQKPNSQFSSIFSREKATSIISNLNTHVYLSIDLEEATELEKELGTYTYKEEDTERIITRPLKTKTELMTLSSESKGIITVSGNRPLLVQFTPYYRTPAMVRKSKLPFDLKKILKHDQVNDSTDTELHRLSIEEFLIHCPTYKIAENDED